MVLHFIDNITIRNSQSRNIGDELHALTETQTFDNPAFTSEISVICQGDADLPPVFHMGGFLARILPQNDIASGQLLNQQP